MEKYGERVIVLHLFNLKMQCQCHSDRTEYETLSYLADLIAALLVLHVALANVFIVTVPVLAILAVLVIVRHVVLVVELAVLAVIVIVRLVVLVVVLAVVVVL